MKNILFYSPDFSMCFSLLMYLQDSYSVTTTTDLEVFKNVVNSSNLDLVIMDAEPSEKVELICKNIKDNFPKVPVILTYVYKNQLKDLENKIRQFVNSIFYKPFDLNEVSTKLTALMV